MNEHESPSADYFRIAGWDVYLSWALTGVAGVVLMTALNIRGIRIAAVVQSAVVAVILLVWFGLYQIWTGFSIFIGAG